MNDLKQFYTTWLRTVTIVIGFFCASVAANFPGVITKIVVSGVTLAVIFLGAEWFIREKMWRWGIFYGLIDFEGKWICVTYYEALETQNEEHRDSFQPYPVKHVANIEQDVRQINISSSSGDEYKGWKSIMMDVTPTRGLAYVYEVEFSDLSNLKGKPIGYEEMEVRQRVSDKNSKPILLVGTFSHCASGQEDVYRGTAVFCRDKFIDKVENINETEPHIKEAIDIIKNGR